MFGRFFKKAKDERDLDQLIYDLAEHGRSEDYELFYKLVTESRFYCAVDPESVRHIPPGERYTTQAGDQLRTNYAEINGLRLIVFFTSKNDERLKNSYIEMDGIDALEMVLKSQEMSGGLFQNNRISWVGLLREKIEWILSKYKT